MPAVNSIEAKLQEELEKLVLELQRQNKLPRDLMEKEKRQIIAELIGTIMSLNLKDPLEFVKDTRNHERLGLAFLAHMASRRGLHLDPSLIKTLLTPKEELDEHPEKRKEFKNVLRILLAKLQEKNLLTVKDSFDKTAEKILGLEPKEQSDLITLLLRMSLVSLYGFDPSGLSPLVTATAGANNSVGIVLSNEFAGERNILSQIQDHGALARQAIDGDDEIREEDERINHYKSPNPFDISHGPKGPFDHH